MADGSMTSFNRLFNRMKRRIGRLKHVLFHGPGISKHARRLYALAQDLPTVSHEDGSFWLSIIVPTYNSNITHLSELLTSFKGQGTAGVELIFVDDASSDEKTCAFLKAHGGGAQIRILLRPENGGIAVATRAGLEIARGTYITFLDHADVIAPHALRVIGHAIDRNQEAQFFYTDELIIDAHSRFFNHITKPAFDPVLLTWLNYVNHFSIYRRDRLIRIGGIRTGFDGSQNYDLVLRYTHGLKDAEILHIPYPAYWCRHTRANDSPTHFERSRAHARKALEEHFSNTGHPARIEEGFSPILHKATFLHEASDWPKISIIIPSRNALKLISQTLKGIYEKTDYPTFEVLVIDNGTDELEVLSLYQVYEKKHENFSAHIEPEAFNFARSVNRVIALAQGEHVLLLNNDVEMINNGWLKEMVSCLHFERAGIIGAKLLYPDDTIQHAGVIVGMDDLAGHWFCNEKHDYEGPMKRLHVRCSMTCVTGAAMLISGDCRRAVGTMDEENFAIAYNDVDYCLRAHKTGFRIIWTPFATLYHHESATRGLVKDPAKAARFKREKQALQRLHQTNRFEDPAHSPHFSKRSSRIKFQVMEKLPNARHWWGYPKG